MLVAEKKRAKRKALRGRNPEWRVKSFNTDRSETQWLLVLMESLEVDVHRLIEAEVVPFQSYQDHAQQCILLVLL